MPKRKLKGIVVSDKMKKTIVVEVERLKQHSKYKRRYKISKRYKAHDEKETYKLGDRVIIEECRPISKDKRWRVMGRIEQNKTKEPDKKEEKVIDKKQKPEEKQEV